MPLDIFVAILSCCDHEDHDEGKDDKTWGNCGEDGEELKNCYGKEKPVWILALVYYRVSAESWERGSGKDRVQDHCMGAVVETHIYVAWIVFVCMHETDFIFLNLEV